jgi:hypothetical protein
MSRTELPGHPVRAERPFHLLVEVEGREELLEADCVLDASGVFDRPLPLGAGGLPATGERQLGERVIRHLGELHRRRAGLAGRRVLVVGHGHSGAHALALLDDLTRTAPQTRIVFATRSAQLRPFLEVAGDPLPERAAVVDRANALCAEPPPHLTVERRAHVEEIAAAHDGAELIVRLAGGRSLVVDEIVGLTGYRPDLSFVSELAIDVSPVSEGAARLWRAISNVTDCLSVPRIEARDLASGEPGFHLIGAKSYGRSRTFLLRTGIDQLETIVANL